MNYKYILGALAALFIVIVFKFLLGQCLNKSKEGCKAKTILKQIGIMVCRMLIFVLSIDYFSTDILKKWLDKKEMQSKSSETQQKPKDKENTKYELRKKAIKYSNTINLILSLFFTVVSFCIAKFCTNKAVCDITFVFVGYR